MQVLTVDLRTVRKDQPTNRAYPAGLFPVNPSDWVSFRIRDVPGPPEPIIPPSRFNYPPGLFPGQQGIQPSDWATFKYSPMPAPIVPPPSQGLDEPGKKPCPPAVMSGFTEPPFQAMRRSLAPGPIVIPPSQGLDEPAKRPYPPGLFHGYQGPLLFVGRDPQAPQRTREHLDLVATILNSLIRQGVLRQTGPQDWILDL